MDEVKQIRDTQAPQAGFSQLDQRLCPVTHQGQNLSAQRLEPSLNQGMPGVIGAMLCHFFEQQVATDKVDEVAEHRTYDTWRSEEHTSELQSLAYLVCRLLLE